MLLVRQLSVNQKRETTVARLLKTARRLQEPEEAQHPSLASKRSTLPLRPATSAPRPLTRWSTFATSPLRLLPGTGFADRTPRPHRRHLRRYPSRWLLDAVPAAKTL